MTAMRCVACPEPVVVGDPAANLEHQLRHLLAIPHQARIKAELSYDDRLKERLLNKRLIDDASGCWLWTGLLNQRGYGRTKRHNASRPVHRVAYELWVGPVPEGDVLDHLCRVRRCFNPAHLEPVSNQENILRGVGPTAANARKTHCKRGHEFTPENTIIVELGRRCRACDAERLARRSAARSAARAAARAAGLPTGSITLSASPPGGSVLSRGSSTGPPPSTT